MTGDLFGLRDLEMPPAPSPAPSGMGVISRTLMAEVGHFVREIPFCVTCSGLELPHGPYIWVNYTRNKRSQSDWKFTSLWNLSRECLR